MTKTADSNCDVCVVGGAGHVGVALALVLADNGFKTLVVDVNEAALETRAAGRFTFCEQGGEGLMEKVLAGGGLAFSSDAKSVAQATFLVVTIGTPIDEFHNPEVSNLTRCFDELMPYLRDDHTIILRSTVAPGTTTYVDNYLRRHGNKTQLGFCPDRVVQGKGVQEIRALPQLISGTSPEAIAEAKKLFSKIAPELVEMSPLEAEFAKLICNAYRYIEFAATNQLYMMVERAGLDYGQLLSKMHRDHPL